MDEDEEKTLRFFREKLVTDLGKSHSSGLKGKEGQIEDFKRRTTGKELEASVINV